ncbi:hypothetical protein [Sodalis sp. dw_96]|uniref:hypothetical protein n=1 Tax=Sodalis sp. dw_96 TaxID=2719794 RepID=UPI001BD30737|nr:hypothetical protein [Sodalis sp. dw_96]
MSIFGLGSCKHEALSPAEHVKSREITALTKQFKEVCNTPINCFNPPKQFEKNLTALRAQVSNKLTTVKNNKATHNSKKSGQLSKLSSDMDRVMKEKGFASRKEDKVIKSPEERNEDLALAAQRKRDKNDGIDMGGMVK